MISAAFPLSLVRALRRRERQPENCVSQLPAGRRRSQGAGRRAQLRAGHAEPVVGVASKTSRPCARVRSSNGISASSPRCRPSSFSARGCGGVVNQEVSAGNRPPLLLRLVSATQNRPGICGSISEAISRAGRADAAEVPPRLAHDRGAVEAAARGKQREHHASRSSNGASRPRATSCAPCISEAR